MGNGVAGDLLSRSGDPVSHWGPFVASVSPGQEGPESGTPSQARSAIVVGPAMCAHPKGGCRTRNQEPAKNQEQRLPPQKYSSPACPVRENSSNWLLRKSGSAWTSLVPPAAQGWYRIPRTQSDPQNNPDLATAKFDIIRNESNLSLSFPH